MSERDFFGGLGLGQVGGSTEGLAVRTANGDRKRSSEMQTTDYFDRMTCRHAHSNDAPNSFASNDFHGNKKFHLMTRHKNCGLFNQDILLESPTS
jgi:hypothetical protein